MPNPIQAVIFDQDGLMFDTESLAATSWFEVGPKYGIHVDGNFLRGIRGCKPDKVKQVCTQQFGEEAMKDYDRFREEKRQYSYRWIAEHGVPVKKGLKELLIYLSLIHISILYLPAGYFSMGSAFCLPTAKIRLSYRSVMTTSSRGYSRTAS